MTRLITTLLALPLLAGCGAGARNIDYSYERGISADIDAAHFRGASSESPGMTAHDEPVGASPWRLGDKR
jgi:hypothetical protein